MHRLIGTRPIHNIIIEEVFQFLTQSQAVLEVVDSDDGQPHEFFGFSTKLSIVPSSANWTTPKADGSSTCFTQITESASVSSVKSAEQRICKYDLINHTGLHSEWRAVPRVYLDSNAALSTQVSQHFSNHHLVAKIAHDKGNFIHLFYRHKH